MNRYELLKLADRIVDGDVILREEAERLLSCERSDLPFLYACANLIKESFAGNAVDLCGIINIRSGCCSEDCRFCAQSAYHQAA